MQSIEKEQSLRHREVFSGGHNAVRSKKQTDALLNEDVSKLSNADIEKVLTFIRTNAETFRQKLCKLYITQQKKQIDVKKTIEKSVQCDGEIARLYYKKPIKSKANVVMLADISGSCRAMTSLALNSMEQAIINVEGTTTIETAAAAKKLIEMFGNRNIRAIAVNRVNDKSDEVIVELDFVPGLAPHLHGFTLQVNGLTCGYAGTGPSNLYEVLQAAGVSEAQVAREDITQKSTKTIPLRLERAVTQYGDFQFA